MTTEQRPALSESEKQKAFLAELEAERARRVAAGKWSRATLPVLMAVVGDGEPELEVAQQRALYEHLAKNPGAPKSAAHYDWIIIKTVAPAPQIELPNEQYAPDHDHAVDVTPSPPWRRPMPPRPPEPPRVEPLSYSNAGVPRVVLERELRRYRNFLDGDWGDPSDGPIPYPRRNRTGW